MCLYIFFFYEKDQSQLVAVSLLEYKEEVLI